MLSMAQEPQDGPRSSVQEEPPAPAPGAARMRALRARERLRAALRSVYPQVGRICDLDSIADADLNAAEAGFRAFYEETVADLGGWEKVNAGQILLLQDALRSLITLAEIDAALAAMRREGTSLARSTSMGKLMAERRLEAAALRHGFWRLGLLSAGRSLRLGRALDLARAYAQEQAPKKKPGRPRKQQEAPASVPGPVSGPDQRPASQEAPGA